MEAGVLGEKRKSKTFLPVTLLPAAASGPEGMQPALCPCSGGFDHLTTVKGSESVPGDFENEEFALKMRNLQGVRDESA